MALAGPLTPENSCSPWRAPVAFQSSVHSLSVQRSRVQESSVWALCAEQCWDLAGRPKPLSRAPTALSKWRVPQTVVANRIIQHREFLQIPEGSFGFPPPSIWFLSLVGCQKPFIQHSVISQDWLLSTYIIFAHERGQVQPPSTLPPSQTSLGCSDFRITLPGLCPDTSHCTARGKLPNPAVCHFVISEMRVIASSCCYQDEMATHTSIKGLEPCSGTL